MQEPAIPRCEEGRLIELNNLCMLDTKPEERFDRFTRLARRVFAVDTALVSLVDRDRQWFKSHQGLEATETPRNISFCGHVVWQEAPLVVEDAGLDKRFFDNPLVTGAPHIRFYAGYPLFGPNGYAVGTLCIIHPEPRAFGRDDLALLEELAALVQEELESKTLADTLLALHNSQSYLSSLLNNMLDGVISVSEADIIETINPAAAQIFGYAVNELYGESIQKLFPRVDRPIGQPFFSALLAPASSGLQERECLLEGLRKDGSVFPLSLTISVMWVLGRQEFVGIFRDITERKRQEALQGTFSAIIESSDDAIISKTLDGVIQSWNQGAEKLFGFSAGEAIGKSMALLIAPDRQQEELEILASIACGTHLEHFETERRHKNGSLIPISTTISPIKNPDGVVIGASVIARDISMRRLTQQLLQQAKEQAEAASKAKSEFLANMSHEIRTPMNAVLGIAQLLAKTPLTRDQTQYLDMICASGRSLLSLLNDILDFSKIEAGRMELAPHPFSLGAVLHSVAAIMTVCAGEKDLELAIGMAPEVPIALEGDALRLQQVLVNLVGNAIKFTAQGEVSLWVDVLEQTSERALIQFRVNDTGIGMDKTHLARLFQEFSQADASMTRRFGGTGLGLTISKRLVEMMGGKIKVQSVLGQGSEFCVTIAFPRLIQPIGAHEWGEPFKYLRLLVVDDNPTSLSYISSTIAAWGWQPLAVNSRLAAVELYRAELAAGRPVDAFMVDWAMPDSDGLSTLRELREICPTEDVPMMLMVNAFGRSQIMQSESSVQPDAILIKPVTGSSLFDTLHELLTHPHADEPYTRASQALLHDLHGLTILLAEDNPLNQIVARGLLEQAGATVEVVGDGQQALDRLRQESARFQLVLMDVQMPVMDGLSAARIIRQDLQLTLPVLAMTAGVTESERISCLEAGMDEVIAKPIDQNLMLATISRYVVNPPLKASSVAETSRAEPEPEAVVEPLYTQAHIFDPAPLLALKPADSNYLASLLQVIHRTVTVKAEQFEASQQSWQQGDAEGAARILHALRGSFATLGAANFAEVALELEGAMRAGNAEQVALLYPRAQQALGQSVDAARQWLVQQGYCQDSPESTS